jgi:hypothetical protein
MTGGAQNLHKAKTTEATAVLTPPWAPPERPAAEPTTIAGERPVFVTDRPWRKRAVAMAIAAGGALLLVWLVGVLAGALGLGRLGPLPLWGAGKAASPAPAKSPASVPASVQARPHPLPALPAVGGPRAAGSGLHSGQRRGAAAPSAGTTRSPAQANADPASGESRGTSKTHPPGSGAQSTPRMPEAAPSPASRGAESAGGEKPPAATGAGGGSSRGPAPARPEATPSGRPIPGPAVTPSESTRSFESNAGEAAGRRSAQPG